MPGGHVRRDRGRGGCASRTSSPPRRRTARLAPRRSARSGARRARPGRRPRDDARARRWRGPRCRLHPGRPRRRPSVRTAHPAGFPTSAVAPFPCRWNRCALPPGASASGLRFPAPPPRSRPCRRRRDPRPPPRRRRSPPGDPFPSSGTAPCRFADEMTHAPPTLAPSAFTAEGPPTARSACPSPSRSSSRATYHPKDPPSSPGA